MEDTKKQDKESKKKSWGDYFTEPSETVYILMGDNQLFKYSSNERDNIDLNIESLQEWFKRVNKTKKTDYGIGNIAMIMHNHPTDRKFSDRDYRHYEDLKKNDFGGLFLMYSHMTKKVYNINEDIKDW